MTRTPLAGFVLLAAATLAAAAPLAGRIGSPPPESAAAFPGWPPAMDGASLTSLPLSAREEAFARDFPGRIGRFEAEGREIVVRWVARATRKLHPASDCYRGLGYSITPLPLDMREPGKPMACFSAKRLGERVRVCERIDGPDTRSWPDVSAWYWHAISSGNSGPWWSYVVAEPENAVEPTPTTN